jgi:hypothetical protein
MRSIPFRILAKRLLCGLALVAVGTLASPPAHAQCPWTVSLASVYHLTSGQHGRSLFQFTGNGTVVCAAPTVTNVQACVRRNAEGGCPLTGAFSFVGATGSQLDFQCLHPIASGTAPTVACNWNCACGGTSPNIRIDKASDGLPVELMSFGVE